MSINWPTKFKDFLLKKSQVDLFKLVEDVPNLANYNVASATNVLGTFSQLRSVPDMLQDPIIQAALGLIMETAFQMDTEQNIFRVVSPFDTIKKELDQFHEENNIEQLALDIGYNLLLWGNLALEHKFDDKKQLIGVTVRPDFTKVVPIILSGVDVGFIVDGEYKFPFEYTFAQLQYYRNLGGVVASNYNYISAGEDPIVNEFVVAPSYLSSASKPWRNINIIEDALLLARMDQSNYYRIISVDVGGSVYSKSAIKVLNYYRNIFKKVRRVSYDASGMAAKGRGQEFEVIVPKSANQGVSVDQVGGNVDVKALKDLDTQYNKLFAALKIQPSQIGFSSDAPSTLNGQGPAVLWDERLAKTCKAVVYSTFKAIRHIDEVYLKSRGYSVSKKDWSYSTVSGSLLEDQQRSELLTTAVETIQKLSQQFRDNELPFNKQYLFKTILGNSVSSIGLDLQKLFTTNKPEPEPEMIGSSLLVNVDSSFSPRVKEILVANKLIDASPSDKARTLLSSSVNGKATIAQIQSDIALLPASLEVDTTPKVIVLDSVTKESVAAYCSKKPSETVVTVNVPDVVYVPSDLDLNITVSDLQQATIGCIRNLIISNGKVVLTSKEDVIQYFGLYLNELHYGVVDKLWKV